jgi:hypothetical protein
MSPGHIHRLPPRKTATSRHEWAHKVFFVHTREWRMPISGSVKPFWILVDK